MQRQKFRFILERKREIIYRVVFPSRRNDWPQPLDAHGESHVLEVRITRDNIVIRESVGFGGSDFTAGNASSANFPQDEANGVHICHLEGIERGRVQALLEDFRRHVSPRPHSRVRCYVNLAALAVRKIEIIGMLKKKKIHSESLVNDK